AGNEQTVGAATYAYSPRNFLASGDGLSYTYDARGLRTITTVTAALGTFSGTVVTATTGAPVAGATVSIDGTLNSSTTDASGNFSITLPAGTFTATITAGGYTSQTTPSFTTQPGLTYSLGTITLAAIPATVNGTVTSSTGGTVAGATVTASGGPSGASHN